MHWTLFNYQTLQDDRVEELRPKDGRHPTRRTCPTQVWTTGARLKLSTVGSYDGREADRKSGLAPPLTWRTRYRLSRLAIWDLT